MSNQVTILGATGSIGQQCCDIISRFPDQFHAHILTADSNVQALAHLAKKHQPKIVAIANTAYFKDLKKELSGENIEILAGDDGIIAAAAHPCDRLITGIGGMAGLKPLMAAIKQGTTIGFANKESLVAGGHIILDLVKRYHATLIPVDSEHHAIHATIGHRPLSDIAKLILTASGGPFLSLSIDDMYYQPVSKAICHPKWQMGAKISVDSASMMNKALEIIEACYLFNIDANNIDVVIHPDAIIHSMITLHDGATLSLMAQNDMRLPISYALTHNVNNDEKNSQNTNLPIADICGINWSLPHDLHFYPLNHQQFPAINLAYDAWYAGQSATITMNAANEIAVSYFLAEKIYFGDIITIISYMLQQHASFAKTIHNIDDVIALDKLVRIKTTSYIEDNFKH